MSSSFSKIGWRRGQQNGNLLGSTTPQKMGYIFKLGAVYIFDRYGVINNGFFAKKKGEEEKDEEVAFQVEAKSFLVVSSFL